MVKVVEFEVKADPLEALAYQSIVFPAVVEADKLTVPVPHLDPLVPDGADSVSNETVACVEAVQPFEDVAATV